MEENKETINRIPNCAILLKNKIYIPYNNKEGELLLMLFFIIIQFILNLNQ